MTSADQRALLSRAEAQKIAVLMRIATALEEHNKFVKTYLEHVHGLEL